MSKARNMADLLDSNGDVVTGALDNVPPSNDASALTTGTLPVDRVPYLGRRNLIINGAMQVAQRGTSSAGYTGTSSPLYLLDRFGTQGRYAAIGTSTISRSTDAPDGFAFSLKQEWTGADTSITGNEYLILTQRVEAQDLQHLAFGTSNAKAMTLSFWVKSSTTGTYVFEATQDDASRRISLQYTVDAADTWEYKTLLIPGDSSGGINDDNGTGLSLEWWIVSGPTYNSGTLNSSWSTSPNSDARAVGVDGDLCGTVGNYFSITGVQLEVGSVATPFEHRSYGEELALCQRYYQKLVDGSVAYNQAQLISSAFNSTRNFTKIFLKTVMRASPSINYSGVGGNIYQNGGAHTITGLFALYPDIASCGIDVTANVTAGEPGHIDFSSGTFIDADAEL